MPVLDIGGSHVTAALIRNYVVVDQYREDLDANADLVSIVGTIAAAAAKLAPGHGSSWGVAIPGPFDYVNGIGDFSGVGKFAALHGKSLRTEILDTIVGATSITFINDAEAYALGEWEANGRPDSLLCITLGTGVGSGFIRDGRTVAAGPLVPPSGNIHTQSWQGRPLEHFISSAAIRGDYESKTGITADVKTITQNARDGDSVAVQVLGYAMNVLGAVLSPWLAVFQPDLVVVGGSMSRSWDVLAPSLRSSIDLRGHSSTSVRPARLVDQAPLVGVAQSVLMHVRAVTPHQSMRPSQGEVL